MEKSSTNQQQPTAAINNQPQLSLSTPQILLPSSNQLHQHQQHLPPQQQQPPEKQPPQNQQQQLHVLFEFSPLDGREEIDDKTQRSYLAVKRLIQGKSPSSKECQEIYMKYLATPPIATTNNITNTTSTTTTSNNNNNNNINSSLEELTMGLLVTILVEQDGQQTSKYYRDIASFTKDSFTLFSTYLNMIIIERLNKLKESSIKQIFWITNEFMKAGVNTAEHICSNLIRQTSGGDLSNKNLWLIESLLDLLNENRNWLINSTNFMVPTIIYTFMRLIADHMIPTQTSALRQKEVDFVIGLIREKFNECFHIGRDFLRLLHNIIRIPEFEKLWHDIFNNPKSLHSGFQNPLTLLSFRTPRRLIQSRLTFDMEKKISFLATQVKFGNQKRYQAWFHKQYLSTPESLSLRCDLIRYICTIIHPSNEVLCSDIMPRWAIIGWLLSTCTTGLSQATSKLTLFYDWLVYDTKVDSIMNIEPAILVMYYSMGSHPQLTASLLDFLCKIPISFSPKLSDHIKAGLKKSLQQVLEKRVIPSLGPLFDNPKHDPALRALIRENFPEFCAVVTPHTDNGISLHPNLATTTTTSTMTTSTTANLPVTTSAAQANHQNISSINHNAVNSNIGGSKQQSDVSIADNEKINLSLDLQTPSINLDSTPNRLSNNIDEQNSTKLVEHSTNIPLGDKLEQSSSSLGNLSPKDESKAFTWNGNEYTNASYSHKHNHDNKNRKSSISISSQIADPSTKRTKLSDNIISDTQKNLTKLSTGIIPPDLFDTDSMTRESLSDISGMGSNSVKVIYPFMTVPNLNLKEALNSFDEPIRDILEDLSIERCNETRCNLMDKLISAVFDNSDQTTSSTLKILGHCIAYVIVDDFTTRIFPSSSQDNQSLEESISKPFFVLCRSAFMNSRSSWTLKPISLLTSISKNFEPTGFLILYFLKVNSVVSGSSISTPYIDFCTAAKRKLNKCLYEDLSMAATYDSEMFCFMLSSIFGELATSGSFVVTGNIDIVRLVVSVIDPIYLQELICLCLTGTAKVINKEDVMPLVEASLTWESWEQYCVWKLITAQSAPVENYMNILPKLDTKANAEAMSCILLNLQKVTDPTVGMIQQLLNCECKPNDPFVSSILRYWSMKTDTKDLAKTISSLYNSRPPSPQMKRKGQSKASNSKNSPSLSSFNEKILQHLDAIRQRAPKNKLLAQTEILEMISELEGLCNDSQKKRFNDLFSNRPKPSKKQKKIEKELTP